MMFSWSNFFRVPSRSSSKAGVVDQYYRSQSSREASRHTKFSRSMDQNNQDEYSNPYPEFNGKSGHGIIDLSSKQLDKNLLKKISKAADEFTETVNTEGEKAGDYTVYTGAGGIALLNLLISQRFDDNGASLAKAEDLLHRAPQKIHKTRATFLQDAGPVAISAVVAHYLGKSSEAKKQTSRLLSVLEKMVENDPDICDECLYGRAGYLYSLLFVRKHLGPQSVDMDAIRQDQFSSDAPDVAKTFNKMNKTMQDLGKFIKEVVGVILSSGKARASLIRSAAPLSYQWHGKNYYGAAHGTAGILYMLLQSGVLSKEEKKELIRPTLDSLIKERLPSGNYPSSQGSRNDRLVQWCHGAPGYTDLFATAYKEFGDERYRKAALEAGEVVWNRGLCTKGYSACHGVSGNAYSFVTLYQLTGDLEHLYRAGCFADWCLNYPKHEQMKPDRQYSLFEGLAGVAYFLTDIQEVSKAGFPAYTLKL